MNQIRSFFMLLLAISYMLNVFVASSILESLMILGCLGTLLLALLMVKGLAQYLALGLLGVGTFLFIYLGTDLGAYFSAYASNVSLLSFFILVPLLSIPIRIGGYLEAISKLYTYDIKNNNHFYLITTSVTYLLSIILNIGAFYIVYQLTNAEQNHSIREKVLRAIQRGYPLSIYWSPYFVSVGLVISYFHVAWIEVFLVGILLSVVSLLIGYWLERSSSQDSSSIAEEILKAEDLKEDHEEKVVPDKDVFVKEIQTTAEDQQELNKSRGTLKELLLIGFLITLTIWATEQLTDLTILSIVPLIAIIASFVWTLYLQKTALLKGQLKMYLLTDLPRMKGEMALFISAGFFGQAILAAGLSDDILRFIHYIGIDQAYTLTLFLFIAVVGLSLIGIHPFVSVLTLCISLSGSDLALGQERLIAMVLLASWPITTVVSPFSGLVLMVSSYIGRSPFYVGPQKNWRYGLYVLASSWIILNACYYVFNF